MKTLRALLIGAALALPSAPLLATPAAPASPMAAEERETYRALLNAIRKEDWAGAAGLLDSLGEGPLKDVARAELYLAKNSPRVELEPLLALLARAPDLPHAAQLARLAQSRGAVQIPPIAQARDLVWLGGQPRRSRAKSVKGDPAAAELENLIQPLIKDDQPSAAEALLAGREPILTPEALAEYRQRIAWSHYITGNDADALRLADQARQGPGEWAVHAEWVAGLAAWRMDRCSEAAARFSGVAMRARDSELSAAGHYWAARAEMKCRRPQAVEGHLRSAAQKKESFYGLLAGTALGITKSAPDELHDYRDAEWRSIAGKPNVKAAIALAELGERNLADTLIRHQARIGSAADHNALLHLASDLNLAGTQHWLAHNGPPGAKVNMAARYPTPEWRPAGGWRVDKALAFAHALQESNFRTQVVSPAGAHGLMQVLPGTAKQMAHAKGQGFDPERLSEPAINLEYGQSYLEYLASSQSTGGLLPKVIAAYNAGPAPIARWNIRGFGANDPLLYIESIPYWETRGYVPSVLRNYWIYEQQSGAKPTSREALAQGQWPRFPTRTSSAR